MPEGTSNPDAPRPTPTPEAPITPGQSEIEAPQSLPHQTLPHVTGHGPTLETALGSLGTPDEPVPPVDIERLRKLPFAERARELTRLPVTEEERLVLVQEVMPIAGGSDDPPTSDSRSDRLRGFRDRIRRGRAGGGGPRGPRDRSSETATGSGDEREPAETSFMGLNQERAIIERRIRGGTSSPEDQARIFEIYQQMDDIAQEARELTNFTVQGNLLDHKTRVGNLQEARLREPDLPPHLRGALVHYVDREARVAREAEVRAPSEFEQRNININALRKAGTPDTDPQLVAEIKARDDLLREANEIELSNGERFYDPLKQELTDTYFHARVKVTREVKEGSDPYLRGAGKLQELEMRRREAREEGSQSWEDRTGFWNNPERRVLLDKYGGTANYINLHTTDIITEVVRDRHRYQRQDDPYPADARGVIAIWDGVVTTRGGPIINAETGRLEEATDFDDVREVIEEQRRLEPIAASNSYDPVTPFRFVADDRQELMEMISYMIRKVNLRIDPTLPQGAENELNQEVSNLVKTLSTFPGLSRRWVRRIRSMISDEFAKSAAYEASGSVRKGWDAYIHFMQRLATGTETKEGLSGRDHIVHSLFLDREGHTLSIMEALCEEDGSYWRYELDRKDTPVKTPDRSALYRTQEHTRKRIIEREMAHKLKPMWKLLGLNPPTDAPAGSVAEPIHPAFARLKKKLEKLDERDRKAVSEHDPKAIIVEIDGNGEYRALTKDEIKQIASRQKFLVVRDQSGQIPSRWAEYCTKAREWQRTGEFGDTENPGRIIFLHPLSRSFRPVGFQVKGEDPTPQDELELMYEPDERISTDKWYRSEKRRKVTESMERARKVSRAFMIDSESALPWHIFPNEDVLAEANKYLALIGESRGSVQEVVPYKTLYRAMMQSIINEDQKKPLKDRQLIWHSLLTEHWGIDLDVPQMALWRLGAHDGLRAYLLDKIEEGGKTDPELKDLRAMITRIAATPSAQGGKDEKNLLTEWAEKERRIGILLDIVMKAKFGTKTGGKTGEYFNQAGHDDRDAGVKDIRNLLRLVYGQSADTVRISGLIPILGILGGGTFGRDIGATRSPGRQMVGAFMCEDEVAYMETGYMGYIESPRDMEDSVGRLEKMTKQQKALTSDADDSPGIWVKGPFSGMFLWRAFNRDTAKYANNPAQPEAYATDDPTTAINVLKESSAKEALELAGKTVGPLMSFMKGTIESTFGQNPGSRKFLNTLYWHRVLYDWVEKSTEYREMSGGPGYAADGALYVARYFMRQVLIDEGLIYDDKQWDKIMLGYVREVGDGKGKRDVVRYEVSGDGKNKFVIGNGFTGSDAVKTEIEKVTVEGVEKWVMKKKGGLLEGSQQVEVEVVEGLIDAFPPDLRDEIIRIDIDKEALLPFGHDSAHPESLKWLKEEIGVNPGKTIYYGKAVADVRKRRNVSRAS